MAMPLEVALVGAGMRATAVFGRYALRFPGRMRIVAVAEPDPVKRERFARAHAVPPELAFDDWRPLLGQPGRAAAAIVATGDALHVEPALAALASGYDLLLEKPMAMTAPDCRAIVEAAEAHGRLLQIGHVLRYTAFYRTVHRIAVGERRLGDIQSVFMAEHVAWWHFTHSFVRGKWRNNEVAAPLILAKCCHDLDLMAWIVGRPCLRVASFGERAHFRIEHAPPGAAQRCTDGCPAERDCLYYAPRFYACDADGWPWSDVAAEPDAAARRRALETSPWGRCVYRCDNDVVDRQSVLLEFEGGVQGSFLVDGFAARPERTIRVQGTSGELRGAFERGEIELWRSGAREPDPIRIDAPALGHGGGDEGLLDHFTDIAVRGARTEVLADGRSALASHLIGFAAERARREGRVVPLAELGDPRG